MADILADGQWHHMREFSAVGRIDYARKDSLATILEERGCFVAESDSGAYWCVVTDTTPTYAPDERRMDGSYVTPICRTRREHAPEAAELPSTA